MRTFVASFTKKFISTFFAVTLALGLVPAAAFAVEDDAVAVATEEGQGASASTDTLVIPSGAAEGGADEESAPIERNEAEGLANSSKEDEAEDNATAGDDSQAAVPATGVINQTMPLEVVAQQESTRSYFLAQTLESTKTVPIVSANLPLDKGTNQGPQAGVDGGTTVGSEDEVADGDPSVSAEGDGSSEDEGGDDSDESDPGASDDAVAAPGVSAGSTVVGSFIYRGIAYAVESGGESVAVVAADYVKLPQEFIEAQTVVLPSMVTSDGLDFYSVTRIADYAFASINEGAAAATREGQDADASSMIERGDESPRYEDDATPESFEDGDVTAAATSESPEGDNGVGDETDGATVDATIGITAVTIPASVVEIGDDAFAGADTLQYVIVSEDNPAYSQYDGCLYDADRTCLLLIPEGRLGAVRIAPSATSVNPEVFSHCPTVDTLVVDPDSAASQLLIGNTFYNANQELLAVEFEDSDAADRLWNPVVKVFEDDFSESENTVMADVAERLQLAQGTVSIGRIKLGIPSNAGQDSILLGVTGTVPNTRDPSDFFGPGTGMNLLATPKGSYHEWATINKNPSLADNYHRVTKWMNWHGALTIDSSESNPGGTHVCGVADDEGVGYKIIEVYLEDGANRTYYNLTNLPPSDDNTLRNKVFWISKVSTSDGIEIPIAEFGNYKVTWDSNGGVGSPEYDLVLKVNTTGLSELDAYSSIKNSGEEDFSNETINISQRNGWSFAGWHTDIACTNVLTWDEFVSKVTESKTYYARWTASAAWDANGGTMMDVPSGSSILTESTSYTEGAENRAGFMAPAAPMAPAGWEFAGWADTAEPQAGETLVQPGEVIYNHLLDEEAKAGRPTFYARYKAKVTFDTSRGNVESGITGTNMTALPDGATVYAHAAEAGKPLAGTLSASSIKTVTQNFYKFNGYKMTPSTAASGTTPGVITWYTYADLPEGTVSANDSVGADDVLVTFADDMAFTIQGASNFTLLWAPIAYKATFDAGKTEYASAPGMVTGMGSWAADAGDGTTVPEGQTSRAWAYTYTYDDDVIVLPAPVLSGYTYEFVAGSGSLLGAEAAAAALVDGKFDAKQAARAADPAGTGASTQTLSFAVTWTKSPYEVQVLGTSFPVGSGHYAFTSAGVPLLTIPFDGANGIVIPELFPASTKTSDQAYFDDDYMASFDGWTIGRLNGGATVSGTPRSHTIALSDIDGFFAAYGTTLENGSIVVYAMPNFTTRSTWKATISLPSDAKSNGTWPGWSSIGNGASRTYSCEDSDQITLPNDGAITRFGYTFSQWKVTARKDGALVTGLPANPYTVTAGENGEFRLAKNTIYDLTLEPDWVAATGTVRLDAGADDAVLEGAVDFTIDFGQSMMAAKTVTGDAFVIPEPTRANHAFLGYFDATGRQYITSGLASARNWDKEPAVDGSAIVLYARWQSDDLDGDGSMDDPQSKVVATSPDDRFSIASTDWSGKPATANVMAGTYNGMMQWNSAAAYPRAFDTVVVNVSSYTLDANSSVAQIRRDFQENAGPNAGKWILGFTVGSQGSYVPFYDIIYGHAVTLTLNGADLVRDGSPTAPAFTVDPTKVKVVWTDVDPGYGDGGDHSKDPAGRPVQAGDVITNVFDAQSGAFKDSYGNTERIKYVTTTVPDSYTGTTKVETAIPDANPVREGYEFLGWSSVPQAAHRDNDDDFKRGKGVNPAITTCETKTYYAHWAPHTYTVELDGNGGAPANTQASWTFGTKTNQDVSIFSREGYVCVGFFDTPDSSGGTMYLDRAGTAMRAWDKGTEVDPVVGQPDFTLYARWAAITATDSPDPFPGISGVTPVVPTTDDNHGVLVSALDANGNSHTVFDGTYEGVFRFRQPVATEIPAATAPVQVQMNYYEPAAGGSEAREAQLAAVQMEFEKYHPTGQEHLLGFRVISTGDFISWADIVAGASIDIDCKGSDLVWDATYERPASFRMNAASADGTHVLEAVYGTTPCVDPNDGETVWPVRGETEVVVVFDALAGRFSANGLGDVRFLAVKSVYGSTVNLPSADSDFPLPNGVSGAVYKPNEGWSFNAWREGADVASAEVTAATSVRGLGPITYYAHYTQSTHTVTFHEADRAGATPTGKDVVNADAAEGFYIGDAAVVSAGALSATPYDKQPYATIGYPLPSASTFSRAGYDFLGWFDSGDASAVTTAYYLTARGEVLAAEGALPARDVTSTITGDMDMYALWIARTYDVTWHYNYPAYTVGSGDEAVEHPGTSGEDDIYRTDEGWVYGQSVPAAVLEGPASARYPFVKWAVERDATSDRIDSPTGSVRPGASADTRWFTPQSTAVTPVDFTAIPLHYYAVWNTQSAHSYGIHLHAGEGGMYSNSADNTKTIPYKFNFPTYVLPTPDTTETNSNFPTTRNGYTFVCWVEMEQASDGSWTVTDRLAETVPSGSTGDKHFMAMWTKNPYTVTLTGVEGLLPADYNDELSVPVAWDNSWSHAFDVDTTETWALPSAAQMNQLNAVQLFPHEGKRFVGWRLNGSEQTVDDGHVFDPRAYLRSFANDKLVKNAVFEAVWTDSVYTIVLNPNTGNKQHDNLVYTLEYGADKKMTLPIPVLHDHTGVFSHWDTAPDSDWNASWVAGKELSVPEIFASFAYDESDVEPSREVTGVMEDGTLVKDEMMSNVITLHATWNGAHHTDVPLVVGMAVDPNTGDMVFADNGYLRTTNTDLSSVTIEGVTFEKTTAADGAGGGTDAVFASVLDDAVLTVRAQKEGDDAAGGYLEIPLNATSLAERQFTRSQLAAAGFESFDWQHRLNITYGLDFGLADPDGSDRPALVSKLQVMKLPDFTQTDADGWSKESYPIARVYYTIGLTR